MPFPQMGPGAARPPKSPLDEALEALMGQAPEQGPSAPPAMPMQTSRHGTPGAADREPFGGIPDFRTSDQDVMLGDTLPPPAPPSPFADVTRENAMQGLAGFDAREQDQFSPFSEGELTQLAARDPNSTAPGAANFWGGRLKEMQGNRLESEDLQRKALAGIQGAIQGTHPAIQFQAEQDARRKAMPATITAQGQFRSAQEAADSRRDVAEAGLEGREINARHGSLDMIMQAIRAMRAKQGGLQDDDATQLKALENLYDALSDELDLGATFAESRTPVQ